MSENNNLKVSKWHYPDFPYSFCVICMRRLEYRQKKFCSQLCQKKSSSLKFINTRLRLIKLLGNCCKHCGTDDKRVLQLDHINGDGKFERKRNKNGNCSKPKYKSILDRILNGYVGLQVLCANCHMIKTYENKDHLPIKKPTQVLMEPQIN